MNNPVHESVLRDVLAQLKPDEPGQLFWVCLAGMSAAACTRELNALLRHLRSIPKSDYGERAECLACIAHVRLRQAAIAMRESGKMQEKDERRKRYFARTRAAYEAKNA